MTFKELSKMDASDLADQLQQLAHDEVGDLVNGEELSGLIGQTNASLWGVDTLEVDQSSIEVSEEAITASADVQFCGDQDLDSPPMGDTISGSLTIRVLPDLSVKLEDIDVDLAEPDYDE
jgi:hypothetical protein